MDKTDTDPPQTDKTDWIDKSHSKYTPRQNTNTQGKKPRYMKCPPNSAFRKYSHPLTFSTLRGVTAWTKRMLHWDVCHSPTYNTPWCQRNYVFHSFKLKSWKVESISNPFVMTSLNKFGCRNGLDKSHKLHGHGHFPMPRKDGNLLMGKNVKSRHWISLWPWCS
jgi:hypothetical protein